MTTQTTNQSTARARQASQSQAGIRRMPFRFVCLPLTVTLVGSLFAGAAFAQVSPEEHAKHHPGQAQSAGPENGASAGSGTKGGGGGKMGGGKGGGMMGGGGGGGMMGGGKGGGMGGMMEKMGAPKPRGMYPQLMGLPDLPMEERGKIEAEAHQRMIAGTELMTNGFAQLADAAPGEDFAAMQSATAAVREGLAQFESGLAAHRAIAEGKSPRNVALQWFKGEMNLLPPTSASRGFRFLGMTAFHSSIMAVLVIFTVAMIWMYFFKMRRASALLETLSNSDGKPALAPAKVPKVAVAALPAKKTMSAAPAPQATSSDGGSGSAAGDCCADGEETCPTEATDGVEISSGVLPVAKKKLCRLRVARITQETADVKTFRLVACHGSGLPFSYLPGQFLTLTLPVDEKPIRRSYTISSTPTQGYFCEITVKREEQGAGSRYLHDNVKIGDTLEVKAPSGKFTFTGEGTDSIVLISGGVGITPMMSVTRALTDMCWSGDIHFIVACRDPEHFIFEEELKQLQQRYENLHVHAAMSRMEKDIGNYRAGRLSKEMLTEWVPDISSQRIHICGAPPMMDSTKKMLAELGVPKENVYSENFGSTKKPKAKVKAEPKAEPASATTEKPATPAAAPTDAAVTFATSNKTTNLEPEETILEASERIGVDIDYSCRVGTCGECAVKLLSGKVTMEEEDGLDPDDKAAGMILACQAIAEESVSVDA